jgi:hypothetical protein
MLTFELPEIIYKVNKFYDVGPVDDEFVESVRELSESYYFKDPNLAAEFSQSFDYENIEIQSESGAIFDFDLRVICTIDVINTLDIIPDIVDL